MANLEVLKVHIKIQSRYQIFDQSGNLPFSIVFGLRRRSPRDTDTRPLILDTSASVFDVPYALAKGLLTLSETEKQIDVDLSSFHVETGLHQYIILPPPVGRKTRWLEDFEVFFYEINTESALARLLKPNTKYSIRLTSTDLGIQRWCYSGSGEIPPGLLLSSRNISEPTKLINSKESAGKATFKTCDSLPTPPNLDIQLRLQSQSSLLMLPAEENSQESVCTLEVSITNTHSEHPVSVQSTGHQRFLVPWGPFQPMPAVADRRKRLVSTTFTSSRSDFAKQNFIVHSRSDEIYRIVHKTKSPVCGVLNRGPKCRPVRSDFTTLWPGKPLLQKFNLSDLLITNLKLADGIYAISVEDLGAWWCWGSVDEVFGVEDEDEEGSGSDEKERIPEEKYKELRPPIWLKSKDKVVVKIIEGKVVCS